MSAVQPQSVYYDSVSHKFKSVIEKGIKKPKKYLPTLTPDEWKNMNGKAQWDSMVALRGPDYSGYETLKYLTTSVIRHRLSDCFRVGGLVNRAIPFVTLPKDQGVAAFGGKAKFDFSHFLGHVQTAATWLNIPIVYVSGETFKDAIMSPGHTKALSVIAKELPSEFHDILTSLGISVESGGPSGDSTNT